MKKASLILLALGGIVDSSYLLYEHFSNIIPPCTNSLIFADCGRVLKSVYATVYGVPLAGIGVVHYSVLFSFLFGAVALRKQKLVNLVILQALGGFLASIYFLYLQLYVIRAICLYCVASAVISFTLFGIVFVLFNKEARLAILNIQSFIYKYFTKRLLFLIPPEKIHTQITLLGENIGRNTVLRLPLKTLYVAKFSILEQDIAGVHFRNPIGLAAGFDYEARLTQSLASLGFGFQSVGTITNMPYKGNPPPMLGRLPRSESLMVNKGFKNLGAKETIKKLKGLSFEIPVGVSIGKTNTLDLKTQKESVKDILEAFIAFENARLKHSYYELNISCPNLYGNITFYPPKNLNELLKEIDKLKLKRPLFVKMPIEKNDKDTLAMLDVVAKHSPKGVIFGNLLKNRNSKYLHIDEVKKFAAGNFSGKPTFIRSNDLIRLSYRNFKDRLAIIGCGGVFSAQDAYTKITLGASLVQLITGLVYQGPQLVAKINLELAELLRRDGFSNISQAVGTRNKR